MVPLTPLSELSTHEQQLLARLRVHVTQEESQVGELLPLIAGHFAQQGPFPVDGGYNQVNNLRHIGCDGQFTVNAGPSTRRIIDFSSPENSLGILPQGVSGHLLSPHYQDQFPLFQQGLYRKQLMDEGEIKDRSQGKILFLPSKNI